jgi:NADH-quinone oxidoreductase subunit A
MIAYKGRQTEDARKPYACGEEFDGYMIQPDYSQFFPFVFFFTILHVVALTIATVPMGEMATFSIAAVYLIGAMLGLFILLRRQG